VISNEIDHVDLEEMKMATNGENLFILNFSQVQRHGKFSLKKYSQNFLLLDSSVYNIDKSSLAKKFKRYHPRDFIARNDSLFLLFSDELYIISPGSDQHERIVLSQDASKFLKLKGALILCENERAFGSDKKEIGKTFLLNQSLRPEELHQFQIHHRYLLHFQNRNYYETYMNGILFLSPSTPFLHYFDPATAKTGKIQLQPKETWYKIEERKKEQYNRLAEKDLHAMFTAANKQLEDNISYNVRIDRVDSMTYLISYFPGKHLAEKGFDWRQLLIILNEDFEIIHKSEYRHQSSRAYIKDRENNTLNFNFHDHTKGTFCYLDGVRYQLMVEPHASWHDNDAERINQEQNQSLLNDKYDLCIYSGKVR